MLPRCNHYFHLACIDAWFQTQSTCPICRTPLLENDKRERRVRSRGVVADGGGRDGVGEGGSALMRVRGTCEVSEQLLGIGHVSSSDPHLGSMDGGVEGRREGFVNVDIVGEGHIKSQVNGEVGGVGLSGGVELVESRPRN